MPFTQVLNNAQTLSKSDAKALITELTLLRRELDEIRANFTAALTKLDADIAAGGATETDYNATCALATTGGIVTSVTAAAARRFTPT